MNENINPLVTIFILNWNRKEETCRAIDSAINQSYSNCEIIIVDNGSTDGSSEFICNRYPDIRLVQLDKNFGCPGGRNRGISHCNGEFIFFCDNDGILHRNAVENAVSCIVHNSDVAIVTGVVRDFDYENEIDTNCLLSELAFSRVQLFQGGISMHRKSIYYQIDVYPDDYMYGGEEMYLSLRVLDAGYTIVKSEKVLLWHKKSIHARDIKFESLQAWGNKLATAYQLFPLMNFIVYFIYFWTIYPIYAARNGFLTSFLANSASYVKRLKKYKRNPIKSKTYNSYNKFKDI